MQLQIIRTNNRTSAYGNLQVLSVAQCNSQHVTTVTSNQRQRIKIDHVTSAFGNTTKKQERVLLFNPLSFSSVVIFCLRSTVRELILPHCVLSLPRERRHNTHHYPLLPNQLGFFFFFFLPQPMFARASGAQHALKFRLWCISATVLGNTLLFKAFKETEAGRKIYSSAEFST